MPCVKKQGEANRPDGNTTGRARDIDKVHTTNEIATIINEMGDISENIKETEFDNPLSIGGSIIFGRTGGVMLAALRWAYHIITGSYLGVVEFKDVEGYIGVKSATVVIKNKSSSELITLRVAVVVGLGDAKKIVKEVLSGIIKYDFIEIMGCMPYGCIGGGGQPPVGKNKHILEERKVALNNLENMNLVNDNNYIDNLYKDFLGEPGGPLAHKLLHTHGNHE